MSATDDTALTERVQAAFLDEKPWRAAVEAVMRHEGYTAEQVDRAMDDRAPHTDRCEFMFPVWQCDDGSGNSHHPDYDHASDLAETYRLFFEESNLAGAVLPIIRAEVAKARAEAWGEGWKERAKRDVYRYQPHLDRDVPGPPRHLNP